MIKEQSGKEKTAAQYEALAALKNAHTIIHGALHRLEHGGYEPVIKADIALSITMAANALAKL